MSARIRGPFSIEGPDAPGCVTLDTLAHSQVTHALATIFTECDGSMPEISYAAGDLRAAQRAGLRQLEIYREWHRLGLISIGLSSAAAQRINSPPPLRVGILIEGADPIHSPAELSWWAERGVVAVGMAWAKSSRYAGGNTTSDPLTPLGRELAAEIDRLNLVHDLSHLSDAAMDELLSLTPRPVIASHSNCRSLIGTQNQRHLRDESIKEIARRKGMIGINLFSPFLVPGGVRDRRASIAQVIAHIEHICELAGNRACVGLGSDMDGGFSRLMLPDFMNSPADLDRIADALRDRGWSDADIAGFTHENWQRFWAVH